MRVYESKPQKSLPFCKKGRQKTRKAQALKPPLEELPLRGLRDPEELARSAAVWAYEAAEARAAVAYRAFRGLEVCLEVCLGFRV